MNKIYIFRPTDETVDCAAVAYAEDGEEITFHVSSGLTWFRNDMGLNGKNGIGKIKHDEYGNKYPNGYELVEVIGKKEMQALIDSGKITNLSFN